MALGPDSHGALVALHRFGFGVIASCPDRRRRRENDLSIF